MPLSLTYPLRNEGWREAEVGEFTVGIVIAEEAQVQGVIPPLREALMRSQG